jgi:hypothetical protein
MSQATSLLTRTAQGAASKGTLRAWLQPRWVVPRHSDFFTYLFLFCNNDLIIDFESNISILNLHFALNSSTQVLSQRCRRTLLLFARPLTRTIIL